MRTIIIVVGILVLGIIFLRRYLISERGVTFRKLFVRKKVVLHAPGEEQRQETGVDEVLPSKESIDPADAARANILYKRAENMMSATSSESAATTQPDVKEIEKVLIQVISLDPSSIDAHHKLGLIYLQQEQFGKAESIYKKLVVSASGDPIYYSNLGLALYSQGKPQEAKMYYKKAIELDSTRAGRFFSLGQILTELGEHSDAEIHLKKAADMDNKNVNFQLTLAQFYIDRGRLEDAKSVLTEALKKYPNNLTAQAMLEEIGS